MGGEFRDIRAPAPKRDDLTPEERAEVERRIAEGKVTVCPPRTCAEDITTKRSREEWKEINSRIARRQARGAMAKQRREQAAAAARSDAADAAPARKPTHDRCACGRWKGIKSPTCQNCERQNRPVDPEKARERGRLGGAAARGPGPPSTRSAPQVDVDELLDDVFSKVTRSAAEQPATGQATEAPATAPRPDPASDLVPIEGVEVDACAVAPLPAWRQACELALVPVRKLHVDHRYQRQLGRNAQRRVRRMAEAFSWARFGAIVVRRAGEAFEVIDGQYRAAAARARHIREVPAIVVSDAGAAVFLGLNRNRANLDAAELYHAELAAGEPEAAELAAVLGELGLTVPRRSSATALGPMQTRAVSVLRVELRQRGSAGLAAGLGLVREAWGARANLFTATVIRAACRVAAEIEAAPDRARGPDAERAALAATLARLDPDELLRTAKGAAAEHGGAAHGHLARLICNAHAEAGGVVIAVGV